MDRIDNVDLREALEQIAKCNTCFHLDNDLGISIEQMERAAKLNDFTEKTLIWVSYPSGIDCYPEREVFQKGTRGYNGVLYHGFNMENELKIAYAVDVTGIKDGRVYGSLYETDLREYAKNVKENAVTTSTMRIYVDDPHGGGKQLIMPTDEFNRRYPLDLVKAAYWRNEPNDPAALKAITDNLWNNSRDGNYQSCDTWAHTSRLYDRRFDFYTEQLLRDLNKIEKPNSRDGQNFTVSLDGIIAAAFNPEQLGRLLAELPYENAAFTVNKGKMFMNLVVPGSEVMLERGAKAERPAAVKDSRAVPPNEKPSVLAALEANEQKIRNQFGGVTGPGKDAVKKAKREEI